MSKLLIQSEVVSSNIEYLVHFTNTKNLPSIAKHGIVPVSRAVASGLTPLINDPYRFDGQPGATSVSVSFPNYKMFYSCRMRDTAQDWAVIIIKPSVLWTHDCAFCQFNAADGKVTSIDISARRTEAAFIQMFADPAGTRQTEPRLKAADPTDVQAEVLVFDVISPTDIYGSVFDRKATVDQQNHPLPPDWSYVAMPGFFSKRSYARTGGL